MATEKMLEDAIAAGALSKEKPVIKRPKKKKKKKSPPPAPQVMPVGPSPEALEAAISKMDAQTQEVIRAVQAQSDALSAVLLRLAEDKPVRLKVVRHEDRNSPKYLLIKHIDVVPVQYRKLDS